MLESKLVVMGVSGCGKSTVAAAVANALHAHLIEGDDHHLPSSLRKMRDGVALTDADRHPWLDRLGLLLQECKGSAVLTCSALKREYRDRLRKASPSLKFAYIDIDRHEAHSRVANRASHFFSASLVDNQFQTLESPVGESGVLPVNALWRVESQRDAILHWLRRPCIQNP